MAGPIARAVLLATLAAATPARAAETQKVALYALVKGDPHHPIVRLALDELAASVPEGVQRVSEHDTSRTLGKSFEAAIIACGSRLDCLSDIGRKASADEVLLLRVLPTGKRGITLQALVVNVEKRVIARKVQVVMSSPEEVKPVLAAKRFEIFGVEAQPQLAFTEPVAETPAPPPIPVTAAPPPVEKPAAPEVALATPPAQEPSPTPPDEVPLVLSPPQATQATATGWQPKVLGYAGFGVSGLGLLAVTGSFLSYRQSQTTRDEIKSGPGGVTQSRAAQLYGQANDQVGRANLLLGVGLAALAVGGGLVSADFLGIGHGE